MKGALIALRESVRTDFDEIIEGVSTVRRKVLDARSSVRGISDGAFGFLNAKEQELSKLADDLRARRDAIMEQVAPTSQPTPRSVPNEE